MSISGALFLLGLPSEGGQGGGSLPAVTFEPEAQAVIDGMTRRGAPPSAARQYFINRTVKRLKACGAWQLATANLSRSKLLVFATETAGTADLIDWFDPQASRDATVTGAPTHTTQRGYSSTTSGNCIRTGIGLQAVAQNDHFMAMGANSTVSGSTASDCGATDAAFVGLSICAYNSSPGTATVRSMSASHNAANGARFLGGNGFTAVNRTASGSYTNGRQGYQFNTVNVASSAPAANTEIIVLSTGTPAGPNGGAGSGRIISHFILCPGLSAAQILEVNAALAVYTEGVRYGEPTLHDAGYAPAVVNADAIFLGTNAASILGAWRMRRRGGDPVIVGAERERTVTQLGGMPANGLSWTDSKNFAGLGGVYRWVYTWINEELGRADDSNSTGMSIYSQFFNRAMRRLLDGTRSTGTMPGRTTPVYFADRVSSVSYDAGTGKYTVVTGDGRTFVAPNFFDNTYSQEAFDALGVPYATGSEASGSGIEAHNGYTGPVEFNAIKNPPGTTQIVVDPYVTPGVPASGLIYGVLPEPALAVGAADPTTQNSGFRGLLVDSGTAYTPWDTSPPPDYAASNYEHIARAFAADPTLAVSDLFTIQAISSSAFDFNTGGSHLLTMDVPNSGTDWVSAQAGTFADREAVHKRCENYIRGLFYWLLFSGDVRIPAGVTTVMGTYTLYNSAYLDPHPNDRVNWMQMIYVRACKRLNNATFKFTGADLTMAVGSVPRSIKTVAFAAYPVDDHNHRLVAYDNGVTGMSVWAQGAFLDNATVPSPPESATRTPVPLEIICADPSHPMAAGFATAVGFSATMVANSELRMEPTMCGVGEAQGEMAWLRLQTGQAFHDLDYPTLRTNLLDSGAPVTPVLPQTNHQ